MTGGVGLPESLCQKNAWQSNALPKTTSERTFAFYRHHLARGRVGKSDSLRVEHEPLAVFAFAVERVADYGDAEAVRVCRCEP